MILLQILIQPLGQVPTPLLVQKISWKTRKWKTNALSVCKQSFILATNAPYAQPKSFIKLYVDQQPALVRKRAQKVGFWDQFLKRKQLCRMQQVRWWIREGYEDIKKREDHRREKRFERSPNNQELNVQSPVESLVFLCGKMHGMKTTLKSLLWTSNRR